MKYIIILPDGMADLPCDALGGKTPMDAAVKPNMDRLAKISKTGMVRTVPEGMPPGSDTANLSVMGYDPKKYYSGRSPLEAVSMGIELVPGDVTYRCNLVTLKGDGELEDAVMYDHSAGEITTPEAKELIEYMAGIIKDEAYDLYPGISYRHCFVMHNASTGADLTPPHDIAEKPVRDYLPKGEHGELMLSIMKKSYAMLKDHPVNRARAARGQGVANCCWFWGEGTKPSLPLFSDLYGISGGVVSAVDLIKGIGKCAGLEVPEVEGATGTLSSNFRGKAEAALDILSRSDFVYIHMEAPDEYGHRNEPENKKRAIELIDEQVLGPVLNGMEARGEHFRMLILPDHPTPLSVRTHTGEPVPFLYYDSENELAGGQERFTEALAAKTGLFIEKGWDMMGMLMSEKGI